MSAPRAQAPAVLLVTVHACAGHRKPITDLAFCPQQRQMLAVLSAEERSVALYALHLEPAGKDKKKEDISDNMQAMRAAAKALLVPVASAKLPEHGSLPSGEVFDVGQPLSFTWRCSDGDDAELIVSHASGAVSAVPVPSADIVRNACAVICEASAEAEKDAASAENVDLRPFADVVEDISDKVSLHCLKADAGASSSDGN